LTEKLHSLSTSRSPACASFDDLARDHIVQRVIANRRSCALERNSHDTDRLVVEAVGRLKKHSDRPEAFISQAWIWTLGPIVSEKRFALCPLPDSSREKTGDSPYRRLSRRKKAAPSQERPVAFPARSASGSPQSETFLCARRIGADSSGSAAVAQIVDEHSSGPSFEA